MSSTEKSFAQQFKDLRLRLGLTQEKIGEMIGVRKTTVCNYESGYSTPTTSRINVITNTFNLDDNYFLTANDKAVKRLSQIRLGDSVPFYLPDNCKGLMSMDKALQNSNMILPAQMTFDRKHSIATFAPDDSLEGIGIKRGSCIIIDTSSMPKDGKPFAAICEGKLILRKYHNNTSGTYMTVESTHIPAGVSFEEIPKDNFVILGIITKTVVDI